MRRLVASAAAFAFWPGAAWAHSPITGIGSFYAGFAHPLLIPAQLLALLALGLWLAEQGLAQRRLAVALFAATLLVALPLAGSLPDGIGQGPPILAAALLLGVLAAARVRAGRLLVALVAASTAVALALDSGFDDPAPGARTRFVAGAWLAATLLVANLAAHAGRLTRDWQRLGLRVAGAWIAAAAAMVSALLLAGAT